MSIHLYTCFLKNSKVEKIGKCSNLIGPKKFYSMKATFAFFFKKKKPLYTWNCERNTGTTLCLHDFLEPLEG